MQGPKDAALGGGWGLILGPVKSFSTSVICGSSYEYRMISAIGEALSRGPSAALEQTVFYRKFTTSAAETRALDKHGVGESHNHADSILDWTG